MAHPIIGIPCRSIANQKTGADLNGVPVAYIRSIEAAGGAPMLLPLVGERTTLLRRYVDTCDGFLFTGGDDIAPSRYGEEPHPTVNASAPERDEMELCLFHEIRSTTKPVLGICRGMQLINVARGGSLIQDIPSSHIESCLHLDPDGARNAQLHEVIATPGSKLAGLIGEHALGVNSQHHQCVHHLGEGLLISARSVGDGIIEGIESTPSAPWCLGVQWHPELLWNSVAEGGAGLTWNLALFKGLINACA